MKYSSKSDVWSFAIVLWEIYTFGKTPYPGHSNLETAKLVMNGYRMDPPPAAPREIQGLMRRCWCEKPEDRPSFEEISQNWSVFPGIGTVALDPSTPAAAVGKKKLPPITRMSATGLIKVVYDE